MLPQWDWRVLELPPRHFSWRIRGNPLFWSLEREAELTDDFDLLLATSMVDLATLRGLVPSLARIPSALYFHENQFAYPIGRSEQGRVEAQMVNLYAALAADALLFNSRYNLDSLVDGCAELLKRLPDKIPAGVPERLAAKAQVVPVPVEVEALASGPARWPGTARDGVLRLVWVGRFEYDKGGERLLAILERLDCTAIDYEIALVGQKFRQSPPVFERIASEFANRLVHYGYLPDVTDYHALLRSGDLVLSTALHEFQGLAVIEAVAAGCHPVVPDRLAYREIYPASCRYTSCLDDPDAEADAALECLLRGWGEIREGRAEVPDLQKFSPLALAPQYRQVLEDLAADAG